MLKVDLFCVCCPSQYWLTFCCPSWDSWDFVALHREEMNFFCTQAFLVANTCDHKNTYFLIVATFEWSHFSWDSIGLLADFFAWL